MRARMMCVAAALVAVVVTAGGGQAASKVRVVASLPDLKSLTEAVGGNLVEVDTLARGGQNPHDVEVRPSLMLKLRRADLLIRNGVEGDPWIDTLVVGAHNARIVRGAAGDVDASRGIQMLGVPQGRVDRSQGDVHPEGNPHYTLDPGTAPAVTSNILEGLARVAPEHRPIFEANRRQFLSRLDAALARWQQTLAPYRGARVVAYHDTWLYFLQRFGLIAAGTIEDRPGIPPSPTHLNQVIRQIKDEKIKAVIYETYADRRVVELVVRDSGAKPVLLAHAVGATPGAGSYLEMLEFNVSALADALR